MIARMGGNLDLTMAVSRLPSGPMFELGRKFQALLVIPNNRPSWPADGQDNGINLRSTPYAPRWQNAPVNKMQSSGISDGLRAPLPRRVGGTSRPWRANLAFSVRSHRPTTLGGRVISTPLVAASIGAILCLLHGAAISALVCVEGVILILNKAASTGAETIVFLLRLDAFSMLLVLYLLEFVPTLEAADNIEILYFLRCNRKLRSQFDITKR